MKAVVLAAGKSTRTHPLTLTRPKPTLPLLGKPLLAHTLEALAAVADEAILVVGYRAEMVRAAFGESCANFKLKYIRQTEQRGTADAVASARDALAGEFLVVNGDDYYDPENIKTMAAAPGAAVLGAPVPSAGDFGVLKVEDGLLCGIDEKPGRETAALVNTGLYKVDEKIFDYIKRLEPSARGELEFTAALESYAADHPVAVVEAASVWLPVVTAHDLLAAQLRLWPRREATFLGGGDCRISSAAAVGGRSVLGSGCDVGANAVVEASLLLDGVTVGEGAAVTGSILGEGVALGADAVVDGAVVGDGARVGEGARLEPGSRVWPKAEIAPGSIASGDLKGNEKE
ncbi:MAG: NTP transferase domain-containing protein [candidate division Zixibacteria bacterium]|nr:NTP transferase domain-containing protein [candidate division Zixibacteria bacterium]